MVAYCINATGAMKTHCKIVPVKARQEILCSASDETDSDARGTSGSATASADVLEAPEIQASNALFDFTETVLTKFFPQHPPDYLVVHRDGVADSQLEAVRQREVNQLRMTQRKRPAMKLAFYVVQKRISHRFLSKNQAYQYGNPLPGTIVDGGHPDYLDFWLVPSMCTLSTARPTRYVELCRDQGVQLQPMQQLAYSMCYMYYNWTGSNLGLTCSQSEPGGRLYPFLCVCVDSVKLPAPTQCAHKIAYLFGEQGMLEPAVHDRLSNYLYFL
jgi:aubergine-like protein